MTHRSIRGSKPLRSCPHPVASPGVVLRGDDVRNTKTSDEYFDGTDIFYNHTGNRGTLFPAQPRTLNFSLKAEF